MAEEELYRLRVRYKKQGRLKYLGHLEVLHTVERIVRRAKLPYAITQGFSPHMKIAFGTALPVGTASNCEYFDLYLTKHVNEQEALEALVAASPKDLAPSQVQYQTLYGKAITTELTRADYQVKLYPKRPVNAETLNRAIKDVLNTGTLEYARGKKNKQLDLAHTVIAAEAQEEAGSLTVTIQSHADNEGSLRPDIFLQAINNVIEGNEPVESLSTTNYNLSAFTKYEITRTKVSAE